MKKYLFAAVTMLSLMFAGVAQAQEQDVVKSFIAINVSNRGSIIGYTDLVILTSAGNCYLGVLHHTTSPSEQTKAREVSKIVTNLKLVGDTLGAQNLRDHLAKVRDDSYDFGDKHNAEGVDACVDELETQIDKILPTRAM